MAIASGFLFPKIYLQEVKKRTKEIRLKNKNQGKEGIKEICSKKGGTSIIGPIILLVIIISIISAIYYIATKPFEEKSLEKNTPYQVGNITYTIPKGYEEGDYTTDDYKYYSAMKEDTYCNITITNITYSDLYENGEDYLNENIYTNELRCAIIPHSNRIYLMWNSAFHTSMWLNSTPRGDVARG